MSTYKKLGLRTMPGVPDFSETTATLGQVLFYLPNVAGWPSGRSWINPATLLTRGNFARTLLFPDPATYGAPDKVVAEGYRAIPLMFPQYKITPHIWNAEKGRMDPVSLEEYREFLGTLDAAAMKAMGAETNPRKSVGEMAMPPKEIKSKLGQIANDDRFNLAVGVYSGFVESYNRVKPIPRTPAQVDVIAMIRADKVTRVEEAVDALCRRFLSVDLGAERHAAIVAFLALELGSDTIDYDVQGLAVALRRTVHLILSAPEYQLS